MRSACILIAACAMVTCGTATPPQASVEPAALIPASQDSGWSNVATWCVSSMPSEEEVGRLNHHKSDYHVKRMMGTVVAGERDSPTGDPVPFSVSGRGEETVLKVDDGFLVGLDAGEWGGRVVWYSPTGDSSYIVSGDQVSHFVRRGDLIFAIEGLAHLGMSEGNIIELKKSKGTWTSELYFKLPDAPAGIDVDEDGSFVVLTYDHLLRIDSNKRMTKLVADGVWRHGLWPTSLVIHEGSAYMGMRAGVARYHLEERTLEWLQP